MQSFPCCIPASPNWFCSSIGDSNKAGIYVFGGKNTIYKLDLKDPVKCTGAVVSHKKNITSVKLISIEDGSVFEHDATSNLYGVSGGEDYMVRLWRVNPPKVLKEHKRHDATVTALAHVPSCFTIISGDAKGVLFSWNFSEESYGRWWPVQSGIISMAICPHDNNLLSVGYANGHILICNTSKHQTIQLYKSHLDEVSSLVWSPVRDPSLSRWNEEKPAQGYLLASSARDKTIKIWNTQEDRSILSFPVSSKTAYRRGKREDQDKAKGWISLAWIEQYTLICGSSSGELIQLDILAKKLTVINPNCHHRALFTISYDQGTQMLITTSMDRQINIIHKHDFSLKSSIPSLGGFVYCLASSPVYSHTLAYGVGDNMIRVWQTALPDLPFKTTVLWQGIKSKVMSMAFHPAKEGILAFGSSDGHVGIYNTLTAKVEMSSSYHQKSVYSISFGPNLEQKADGNCDKISCLYSCGGEGVILKHAIKSLDSRAVDINTIIRKHLPVKTELPLRSEVRWHHDLILVAIGNDNGSIEVFQAPNLKLVANIFNHKKIVNCLRWHPQFPSSSNGQDHHFWLASGASDNRVLISDLSDCDESGVKTLTPIREFCGHTGRITSVDWSPHEPGKLAIGSYDCTVQVWDVLADKPLANFREHQSRVLSVLWNPIDNDAIYSGDEEFNLYRWRPSEQEFKSPPERPSGSEKRKRKGPKQLKVTGEGPSDVKDSPQQEVATADGTLHLATAKNGQLGTQSKPENVVKPKERTGEVHSVRRKGKSLLPLCAVADQKDKASSQQECVLLAEHLHRETRSVDHMQTQSAQSLIQSHTNLALFSDWSDILRMLKLEGKHHFENRNFEHVIHLELWKSNIHKAMKIATEEGQLNETLVALSAMAGVQVWKTACRKYAAQLVSNGAYHQAASYYVAANESETAIQMFKEKSMFREAIVLAKLKLRPSDPIITDIYATWARKVLQEGAAEHAAKCYLAIGQISDAIHVLAKKGDPSSLETAVKVALKTDNLELAHVYMKKYVNAQIANFNWKACHDFLDAVIDSKTLRLFVVASEALAHLLVSHITCTLTIDWENVTGFWDHECPNISNSTLDVSESRYEFVAEILLRWCEKMGVKGWSELTDKAGFSSESRDFLSSTISVKAKSNEQNLVNVSLHLTRGVLNLLDGNVSECFKEWLCIFSQLFKMCEYEAIEKLNDLLLPTGPSTVAEYLNTFCSRLNVEERVVGFQLLRNFEAFVGGARLYRIWWGRTVHFPGGIQFTMVNDDTNSTADIENLWTYFCLSLLSAHHIEVVSLNKKHEKLTQNVMELDLRKRLAVHIKEQAKKTPKGTKEMGSQRECSETLDRGHTPIEEDSWNAQKDSDPVPNIVKAEERGESRSSQQTLKQNSVADLDVFACEEKLKGCHCDLNETRKRLDKISCLVRDFPFPDPTESCKILLFIFKRLKAKGRMTECLSSLFSDVISFSQLESCI